MVQASSGYYRNYYMRDPLNDQFYTKPEIAKECCSFIDLERYSSILEPSAGEGVFLDFLPSYAEGLDIDPKRDDIKQVDFFDYKGSAKLVIGNPPFGKVSSLAIKFFNHAAAFADTIAFIIPRTFRRVSVQNKLDLNFSLVLDHEIPTGSFIPTSMKAKCCFQVWELGTKREKVELPLTHPDFKVMSHVMISGVPVAPEGADFAIRAYGSNIGQISFDIEELAPKSWHFITLENESLLDRFESLDYYPLASWTARQDSIGKADLIYLYTQKYGRSPVNSS